MKERLKKLFGRSKSEPQVLEPKMSESDRKNHEKKQLCEAIDKSLDSYSFMSPHYPGLLEKLLPDHCQYNDMEEYYKKMHVYERITADRTGLQKINRSQEEIQNLFIAAHELEGETIARYIKLCHNCSFKFGGKCEGAYDLKKDLQEVYSSKHGIWRAGMKVKSNEKYGGLYNGETFEGVIGSLSLSTSGRENIIATIGDQRLSVAYLDIIEGKTLYDVTLELFKSKSK
ncbi:MAG: hypothetical protein GOU97_02590 [Nanoarchaeota archaeon]|nr:hypothetical protein [Nanoarchaeota archaeon]